MADSTVPLSIAEGQDSEGARRWAPPHGRPLWSPRPGQNISQAERLLSAGLGAALLLGGLARGRVSGLLLAVAGGSLLYRGTTGHCHAYQQLGIDTCGSCNDQRAQQEKSAVRGMFVRESISIDRPAQDLYTRWANLAQLPQILRHITSVVPLGQGRSRWEAEGPFGKRLQWEAEIINHRPGEMIAWQSLPGGDVQTAGSVRFTSQQDEGKSTMTVTLQYDPPGGRATAEIAEWWGAGLESRLREDLRQFKATMESAPRLPTH